MASADKKKQQVKSKLSAPSPGKHIPYRIEIASGVIKVIRVDAKGNIISHGKSKFATEVTWSEKSWIDKLSQNVKEAAREAKVPKGTGFACTVVTGGPNIIMQRFTWPELVHNAMLDNARHEISSYLPGVLTNFIVGAEVQKRNESEDGKASTMDVFVAAINKDVATAISTAVTWAGFKVISLDISENVRPRFVSRHCIIDGSAPSSYGILDLNNPSPNFSLYLNGLFYSTHHFSHIGNPVDTAMDLESLKNASTKDKASSKEKAVVFDVEAILGEISFVVDFVKYQERNSNLECILVIGNIQDGMTERLSSALNLPVHKNDVWMNSKAFGGISGDSGAYIDAYASALPSAVIGTQHMLNMKTAIIVKNPKRQLFMMATGILSVMLAILAVGIAVPFMAEQRLQREHRILDEREREVTTFVAASPTDAAIEFVSTNVEYFRIRLHGINAFYTEFAQAAAVVPILFGAEVTDIYRYEQSEGFNRIVSVEAEEDVIIVAATAIHFDHVAGLIDYFRTHVPEWEENNLTLFRSVGVGAVIEEDTMDFEQGTARFNKDDYEMILIMRREMGER
jgi:Tfp pilus assembly PilM family ATPase